MKKVVKSAIKKFCYSLHGEAFAAFGPTVLEDLAPVTRRHSFAETVLSFPFKIGWGF